MRCDLRRSCASLWLGVVSRSFLAWCAAVCDGADSHSCCARGLGALRSSAMVRNLKFAIATRRHVGGVTMDRRLCCASRVRTCSVFSAILSVGLLRFAGACCLAGCASGNGTSMLPRQVLRRPADSRCARRPHSKQAGVQDGFSRGRPTICHFCHHPEKCFIVITPCLPQALPMS